MVIRLLVLHQEKEIDHLVFFWIRILNFYLCLPFTVVNGKLITVKDVYLFTIVIFVNGNYEVKIEELLNLSQTFFTN